MTEERQLRVEKAMRSVHILIGVCRLHGPESTVFKHSMNDNMPDILGALEGTSRIDLGFEDGRIRFDGGFLAQNDQYLCQLSRIMLRAGVHMLILRSGVRNAELAAFIHILTEKTEEIRRRGITELLREEKIVHIEAGDGSHVTEHCAKDGANVYNLESDGPVFSIE